MLLVNQVAREPTMSPYPGPPLSHLRAALAGFTWIILACGTFSGKPTEDCEAQEAQVNAEIDAWCVEMCAVAYEAGLAQGHDCATESWDYARTIDDWYRTNNPPDLSEEYSECYAVLSSACGQASDHDDLRLDPFDYGYNDGWTIAGCSGDPVGSDMEHLQWPADTGDSADSASTVEQGWYPCPALSNTYSL